MLHSTSALLLLLTCQSGHSVEGRTETTFSVDVAFSDVVHKLDTMESLRRALESQGMNLLGYELTARELEIWTQTLDAEANIKARAPRISPNVGHIRHITQIGLNHATIDFTLQTPIGLLAGQHYMLELESQESQTQIRIQMYVKANVPWSRLRSVRRLVNRIARRRVADEICRNRANLMREITKIVTEDRPKDAQSIFFP